MKKNPSSQKVHTKNNQAFQKVALKELKNHTGGLSTQELIETLTSSGVLDERHSKLITLGALSTLERSGFVEKATNSSPIRYKVTVAGQNLTSLRHKSTTTEELKSQIIELLDKNPDPDGWAAYSLAKGLGYAGSLHEIFKNKHNDVLGQMIADGELALTPQGRYILPQR